MSIERFHRTYSTKQRQGTNGRLACLECEADIVDPRRSTFCGEACADSFYIKTRPGFVRQKVFERDHGICAKCGTDTMDGVPFKRARGYGHMWQADHILPVVEGGGKCSLDNYRALCTTCHKAETAALASRRANARKLAKPLPLLDHGGADA